MNPREIWQFEDASGLDLFLSPATYNVGDLNRVIAVAVTNRLPVT